MRWKIIVVNAGIVVVVSLLSYVLLYMALTDVVANPAQRKQEVAQALRAANAQLALDALRFERWLAEQVTTEGVRGVFSGGVVDARRESATAGPTSCATRRSPKPHSQRWRRRWCCSSTARASRWVATASP